VGLSLPAPPLTLTTDCRQTAAKYPKANA